MRSRRGSVFIGAVLVWLMCVGSAWAADVGDWIWSGSGTYYEVSWDPMFGGASEYSFSLVSLLDDNKVTLLNNKSNAAEFTVSGAESVVAGYSTFFVNPFSYPMTKEETSTGSLKLGDEAKFAFEFSDGSSPLLYSIVASGLSNSQYKLQSEDGAMAVYITAPEGAKFSAVPIPGSVLLLGSSVLGLLGIAGRKNRA